MFLGEFGAFRAGGNADRARWASFMRENAENLGVSWAWWELASGFGLYDPVGNVWDVTVVKALLPESGMK
jgi:endoglucanase